MKDFTESTDGGYIYQEPSKTDSVIGFIFLSIALALFGIILL